MPVTLMECCTRGVSNHNLSDIQYWVDLRCHHQINMDHVQSNYLAPTKLSEHDCITIMN
jgi:hypothetical protein